MAEFMDELIRVAPAAIMVGGLIGFIISEVLKLIFGIDP